MEYRLKVMPKMLAINEVLLDESPGINHCISELGRNVVVEVAKSDLDSVLIVLKRHFPDVAPIRNAYLMLDVLHDFILLKPMVSESPVVEIDYVKQPSLEKMLVDRIADKEYSSESYADKARMFQRYFELFPVNLSRLRRYASRKGKKEEVNYFLNGLNKDRIEIVHAISNVLADSPIEKAWIFGSFARMEEGPESDVDLLVDFCEGSHIGLLALSSLIQTLEERSGRRIDLVAKSSLKSFAKVNVDREKILIYERAS